NHGLDDGLSWAAFMNIANEVTINFDAIGLELRQQLQTAKTSTKVIEGDTDPRGFQGSHRLRKGFKLGDNLAFSELNDDLFRNKTTVSNCIEQIAGCLRHLHQRHGQQ